MTCPDGLLILIDALRYDLMADRSLRHTLMPNLNRLVASGSLRKITAQASNTQFVMPAFLSGTAPMDYGGYNDGCKRRPVCFTEIIREAGYETALFSNCVLYNRDLGFDRGFDVTCVPINSRRALMQDIEYRLLEPIRRWRSGELGDSEISEYVSREFGEVLENLIRKGSETLAGDAIPRARRINRKLARDAKMELELLGKDPLLVAQKLANIPEAYYYSVLGAQKPGVHLLAVRIINKIYMGFGRFIQALGKLKFLRFGHFDSIEPMFEELIPLVKKSICRRQRPWFAMLHVMDVHTHSICIDQLFRSPLKLFKRLVRLPRIRRLCRKFGYEQHVLYFLGLSVVDDLLGELFGEFKNDEGRENPIVIVTSDHGNTFESHDKRTVPDLPNRFFRSDLEIPLIVSTNSQKFELAFGLHDSRDVGATLLECLGLEVREGYDGYSLASKKGRKFVISENAGRNYCDLGRDDLNFAVTGPHSKLFAVLRGSELVVTNYYDLKSDPGEMKNIVDRPEAQDWIVMLLDHLWCERAKIFRERGCKRLAPVSAGVANE